MDLCVVVPDSTPPRLVINQLNSLPPVGICNKFLFNICLLIYMSSISKVVLKTPTLKKKGSMYFFIYCTLKFPIPTPNIQIWPVVTSQIWWYAELVSIFFIGIYLPHIACTDVNPKRTTHYFNYCILRKFWIRDTWLILKLWARVVAWTLCQVDTSWKHCKRNLMETHLQNVNQI